MDKPANKAVAIVGAGALMPDAPNAPAFWQNIKDGRYSVSEVSKDRWDAGLYYDPDPKAPDKTYTKIGGWVRDWEWDPLKWKLPIPPRVGEQMDLTQKWGLVATREALSDYGYPERPLDPERTAVIFGNAMGGDTHLFTATRILFPEYATELSKAPSFSRLPAEVRDAVIAEMRQGVGRRFPQITEDTMPGELSNIIAGRIAALFNFRGPNYVADAACASTMAAVSAAFEGLEKNEYDAVITGGIDANMCAQTFVKFCKIGALSGTGTRPYAEGADGFVMGEGAAVFVIKRLQDAERDGDKIYAVIRAIGGSSDGRGKGITAPNPVGQKLAVRRAWRSAELAPSAGDMVEGHGTSTAVGDVVEVESMAEALGEFDVPPGSLALGSVKSNIGHLKGAAGAAGLFKAALSLHDKVLPPSVNFHKPNPGIDFEKSPFTVSTRLRPWDKKGVRRAGVSAFGFGGTNFHAVLEEYVPGRLEKERKTIMSVGVNLAGRPGADSVAAPLRGAMVIGADSDDALRNQLLAARKEAESGHAPPPALPAQAALRAPVRVAIDYGDAEELADKAGRAITALDKRQPGRWKALRAKGIFLGRGAPQKVAFLFTGQGSQYVNMLRSLKETEPIVADTFAEADRVMKPLLEKPLSDYIFVDDADEDHISKADHKLRQTIITQPAVLAAETALARLLAAYGISPNMVMGHSLGEYGALVASGGLPFDDGLRAVSARGGEMTRASKSDNGLMAAVHGPIEEIERIIGGSEGYVVVANLNSTKEAVIGGGTRAVQEAMEALREAGYSVTQLAVSHAFHTNIVGAAAEALVGILKRMKLQPPAIPVVANISGEFYPMGPGAVPGMIDILARQVASPVQFVKGLNTLYDAGARVFVELGPKRALYGFAEDVVGSREDATTLFTNHPRIGDVVSFNHALCGLYAAGVGAGRVDDAVETAAEEPSHHFEQAATPAPPVPAPVDRYVQLGHLFAEFLDRGFEVYKGTAPRRQEERQPVTVCITGASLGLPGGARVFDDDNVERILSGEQRIEPIPMEFRRSMADKGITRLVKGEGGQAHFDRIADPADVVKLAARGKGVDLVGEFGFPEDRLAALDNSSVLAIGAGIDALRDAGIPLVMRYKTTTTGTRLRDRWMLPEGMRDDTGVIFGSAFPGCDSLAGIVTSYERDRARRTHLAELIDLRSLLTEAGGSGGRAARRLDTSIHALREQIEKTPHSFDRRFLFRVLAMGHAQFAEYIGARGPNTHLDAACATGTQAVGLANDWIRNGRCRRVIVVTADDVTSDNLLEWFGSGFLASGAAATDAEVEDAATPFDRRRHGLIVGMGGAAMVLESNEAAAERGVRPICEILNAVTANSAYHGSRLDVEHICGVMEKLVSQVERRWGISRGDIAREAVFVSHETYTPARGGSASAEVAALRRVFGASADAIVMANTKGFTGHPMAVAIEEVVAVKILETGIVPPVPNYKELDPELGRLNLSKGGSYPVRYALRLGAGFGSQISMSLCRWIPPQDGLRRQPRELGHEYRIADPRAWESWLRGVTGVTAPELEVVKRTLRIKDDGRAGRGARGAVPTQAAVAVPVPEIESGAPVKVELPRSDAPGGETASVADEVRERVLQIVAQQTGYPTDMLDLDLDLEADLGIDTVKQAETFAAIREAYGIPRDDDLKLRDYPTLARAIQFVFEKRPDLEPGAAVATDAVAAAGTPDAAPEQGPPFAAAGAPDASSAGTVGDEVAKTVMAIIADKTGYPTDMLDLDLDLEADLGIDTVKQAETFAAIREAYGIPRDDDLKMRDYPTLAHAIQFVFDKRPDLGSQSGGSGEPGDTAGEHGAPVAADAERAAATAGSTEFVEATPRRVPVAQLRPHLELCKPTGVQLDGGSRVVVMADAGGVGKALVGRLKRRGVDVLLIGDLPSAEAHNERHRAGRAAGPVQGVFWLPAMDDEGPVQGMGREAWREATRVRVKLLYQTMRHLYDGIGDAGTFLISATRLGGRHGYDEAGASSPLGGAVTGFTKAFKREKPGALVKAVDFETSRKTAAFADLLIEETLRDPGTVEVGYKDGYRWSVGLAEEPPGPDGGVALDENTVFVITGAAGSIVSAITADLATASGGTFHLLDLMPEADPGDPEVERFRRDREGLKLEVFERLKEGGKRATPAMVERELSAIERRHAALAARQAIDQAGGTTHYYSVDLLDGAAVEAAMEEIKQRSGRVDVLIHAAGLEISHTLPDKKPAEFDLVFDVKSDGWFNMMSAMGDMPLGAVVVFSSIAGRFGNAGQTDYSAANDFLCKAVSSLRNTRAETRGVAIDWTAWADIGMASRGSIPSIMKQAGIDMIAPDVGIPIVRRELTRGETGGEVVIANRLGAMLDEFDETGGLDTGGEAFAGLTASRGVMSERLVGMGLYRGLTVETTLDPKAQPFLYDHQIDGTPVLPGVMGIEALVESARSIFPGRYVGSVEDVNFMVPFKFYRGDPRTVTVEATFREDCGDILADCRLVGTRKLHGQEAPEITTHFTACVRLVAEAPGTQKRDVITESEETRRVGAADIYKLFFHGPAYQVVDNSWRSGDEVVGVFKSDLPANHEPANLPTLALPRLIELCFQTAGISEMAGKARMGLPHHIDLVRFPRLPEESGGRYLAAVTPDPEGGFDAQVVDDEGNVYLAVRGYRTMQLPNLIEDELLRPLQSTMGSQ
ncbi:MAG: SDR family NAD(P)-dependent oxidoreductase [Candidatus Krumholzibacteriia bacterium]